MNILTYLIIIWYILNTVCLTKLVYDDIYKKGFNYTTFDIIMCSVFVFFVPISPIIFIFEYKDFIIIKGKKNNSN